MEFGIKEIKLHMQAGGVEVVGLKAPTRLRAMFLLRGVQNATENEDLFALTALSMSALLLTWEGPELGIPRVPTNLVEAGEAIHGALLERYDIDLMAPANAEVVGDVMTAVVAFAVGMEHLVDEEADAAAEVFTEEGR